MGAAAPYLVNLKSNTMKNTLQRYEFLRLVASNYKKIDWFLYFIYKINL